MFQSLLVLTLSLGFSLAQAAVPSERISNQVDFTISPNFSAGEKVYYDCWSAESAIEDQMEKMGAKNIEVRCTGGLNTFNPDMSMPAHILMTFTNLVAGSPGAVNADWKQMRINSFGNCHLMSQVYDNVKASLELQNVKGPGHCSHPDSSFHMSFMALVESAN
jgi:hypothetical protein